MTFTDSFKTCFKKYATFRGRASRSEYWWFALAVWLGLCIPGVNILWFLVVIIPSWAAAVRRLHDTGHSGWWVLVPIYNLVLAVSPTEAGSNKWGPESEDDAI